LPDRQPYWLSGRSSLGRPLIVPPRSALDIVPVQLCEASRLPSGLLRACRRASSRPAPTRARQPERGTPRNASGKSRHVTTSGVRHKPGTGAGFAGSYISPAVLSGHVPIIRRIDRPAPRACPPRGLPRNGDQSNLWTTHSDHERVRNADQPPLVERASRAARGDGAARIAPGICVSAGADCRK
jgi:hypothetical protein